MSIVQVSGECRRLVNFQMFNPSLHEAMTSVQQCIHDTQPFRGRESILTHDYT